MLLISDGIGVERVSADRGVRIQQPPTAIGTTTATAIATPTLTPRPRPTPQETAHALHDECIQIADDSNLDPRDRHIRIETRMRVAGKLNQRAYGDQPRNLTQTYVAGDVQIVADEATRKRMIEAREKFLTEKPKSLPANPQEAKTQAGTPIGATHAPNEQPAEDRQQNICQPGATFTPYWEPHGVSEADLYG